MHSFGFSFKYFVDRHHQHLRMTKGIEYSLLSLTTISKKKKYICDDYVQSIILNDAMFCFWQGVDKSVMSVYNGYR